MVNSLGVGVREVYTSALVWGGPGISLFLFEPRRGNLDPGAGNSPRLTFSFPPVEAAGSWAAQLICRRLPPAGYAEIRRLTIFAFDPGAKFPGKSC
jgi:hypothetical protein